MARDIGNRYEELHDDLINALQVYQIARNNEEQYSLDLVHYAIKATAEAVRGRDFGGLYSSQPVIQAGRLFAIPCLILIFGLGIFPSSFRAGLQHMLHPTTQYKPTPVEEIMVQPGNVTRVEGDSCEIEIRIKGAYRGPVLLSYREDTRKVFTEKTLEPDSAGRYQFLFADLRVPVRYFVRAEEKVTPVYTIQVEKRPFIRNLKVQLIFPAYTNLAPRYQDDNVGDVTAILGTRVRIRADVNKSLRRALLIFRNGVKRPLKIFGDAVRGEFIVRSETSYHFVLEDRLGYTNLDPIEYLVRPLPDQPPIVAIVSPGRDVDLTEEMKLQLSIEAEHDFGF